MEPPGFSPPWSQPINKLIYGQRHGRGLVPCKPSPLPTCLDVNKLPLSNYDGWYLQREQQKLEVFPNHSSWEKEKYIQLKMAHKGVKEKMEITDGNFTYMKWLDIETTIKNWWVHSCVAVQRVFSFVLYTFYSSTVCASLAGRWRISTLPLHFPTNWPKNSNLTLCSLFGP